MKRRDFLATNVLFAGTAVAAAKSVTAAEESSKKGRVRQSIMGWCFKPMDAITLAGHCKRIGLQAMEGISSGDYDAVTKMGLKISLVGSHGFAKGPLDPDNHAEVETEAPRRNRSGGQVRSPERDYVYRDVQGGHF